MIPSARIYLDYAAATPILSEVWTVFEYASKELWANPNGIHHESQKASAAIEQARVEIAKIINCKAKELTFTASATESNNLAIQGLVKSVLCQTMSFRPTGEIYSSNSAKISHFVRNDTSEVNSSVRIKPHILLSPIEHPSVLNTVEILLEEGSLDFDFLKIDNGGLIDLERLEKQILPETVLISIIWVNNEIGTIQPIQEIATKLKDINQNRTLQNLPKVLLHVDASQAFLFQKVDLKALKIDLMTLSGHKMYAPRGTALLYIKDGVKIRSNIGGGGQESGLRSGTQNTAGILVLAKAMEIADSKRDEYKNQIALLQEYIFQKLNEKNQNQNSNLFNLVKVNGIVGISRVENNVNFSLKNIDHQTLHTALDLAGFALSGGSSCSSGSLETSSVIQAIRKAAGENIPEIEATFRITLGLYNTKEDIDKFFEVLEVIVGRLK